MGWCAPYGHVADVRIEADHAPGPVAIVSFHAPTPSDRDGARRAAAAFASSSVRATVVETAGAVPFISPLRRGPATASAPPPPAAASAAPCSPSQPAMAPTAWPAPPTAAAAYSASAHAGMAGTAGAPPVVYAATGPPPPPPPGYAATAVPAYAHVARGATGGDTFRKYLKMELAANDSSSEYRYFLFKCDEVD